MGVISLPAYVVGTATMGSPASRAMALASPVLQVVTLTNVICVIFVTHAYETVFLIHERESDLLRVARLERMQAEAELGALKAQIDPHFLFNSLNTLGHLITHDAQRGREFCDTLAGVYRDQLLTSRDPAPMAEAIGRITASAEALIRNPNEALLLEALLLRVPALA